MMERTAAAVLRILWTVMPASAMAQPLDKEGRSRIQGSSASAQIELANTGLIDQNKVDNVHAWIRLLARAVLSEGGQSAGI